MSNILPFIPSEIVDYEIIPYLPLSDIGLDLEDPAMYREYVSRIGTSEPFRFLMERGTLMDVPEPYLKVLPYSDKEELFHIFIGRRDFQSASIVAKYLKPDDIRIFTYNLDPVEIQRLVLSNPELYIDALGEEYAESLQYYPITDIRQLRDAVGMYTIFADYAPDLLDTYFAKKAIDRLRELIVSIAIRRARVDPGLQGDVEDILEYLLEQDPESFWEELAMVDIHDDELLSVIQRFMYDPDIRSLMNQVVRVYELTRQVAFNDLALE